MIEPELLTEVPAALKRLAKQVVRGFYGMEHALALDVLIRNPCVREEDMQELLKFDRKQLRSVLNTLKADKFVKCRMRVETAPDGKTTRHNYYFINYRWCSSFATWHGLAKTFFTIKWFGLVLSNDSLVLLRLLVNVVKYKLDHMRRRIETDERDSTNRASFRCPCCFSTFTDLEANQLFDPMTGMAQGLFPSRLRTTRQQVELWASMKILNARRKLTVGLKVHFLIKFNKNYTEYQPEARNLV